MNINEPCSHEGLGTVKTQPGKTEHRQMKKPGPAVRNPPFFRRRAGDAAPGGHFSATMQAALPEEAAVKRIEISAALEEMAMLLELTGANPFKARAHAGAARALAALTDEDFAARLAGQTLTATPGIGTALAAKIQTLFEEGMLHELDDLRRLVPPGLLQMLGLPGFGIKRVKQVRENLGLETLGELEQACRDGRLAALSGFGAKTAEKLLAGIVRLRERAGWFGLDAGLAAAAAALDYFRQVPGLLRVELAGDLRRGAETVDRVQLAAAGMTDVAKALQDFPLTDSEPDAAAGRAAVRLINGLRLEIELSPAADFPAMLLCATGRETHLAELRELLAARGFRLEHGRLVAETGPPPPVNDETGIYRLAGLPFIPPELREGEGELAAAASGDLPCLLELADLQGVLHVHSTYSDGSASLEEMARACRARGFHYLAVCDHSRSAFYAGGLKEDDVRRQHEEIDRLNEGLEGFRILKGIETDILKDGRLDYSDAFMESFELVVASVHSSFQLPEKEMTERVLQVLHHPAVDVLGHPTGRLLLQRDGYRIDLDAVLATAAETGTAMELNSHPSRLDLDWRHCRLARQLGIPVAINPDAHQPDGLDDLRFGVFMARKAWLEAHHVLNCRSAGELLAWRQRRKAGRHR